MLVQVVYYTYQNDPQGYQLNQIIDVDIMEWEAFKHGNDSQKMYEFQQMYSYRVQRMVFQAGYTLSQQVNANVSFPVPPLQASAQDLSRFAAVPPVIPPHIAPPGALPYVVHFPPTEKEAEASDQAEENEQEPEKAIEPYRHPSDWE